MDGCITTLDTQIASTQIEDNPAIQDLFGAYPTPIDNSWQDSYRECDTKPIFSSPDSCTNSVDFEASWPTANSYSYCGQNGWIAPNGSMPANGRSYSDGDTRKMKRQAQNRAAQRAFRERKEIRVQNLYEQIAELDATTSKLGKENEALKSALELARAEIDRLNCMKSVSRVLESVSVDQNVQAEKANSKQGPTIVLRLDLGGLASLLASSQTPTLLSPALPDSTDNLENTC